MQLVNKVLNGGPPSDATPNRHCETSGTERNYLTNLINLWLDATLGQCANDKTLTGTKRLDKLPRSKHKSFKKRETSKTRETHEISIIFFIYNSVIKNIKRQSHGHSQIKIWGLDLGVYFEFGPNFLQLRFFNSKNSYGRFEPVNPLNAPLDSPEFVQLTRL